MVQNFEPDSVSLVEMRKFLKLCAGRVHRPTTQLVTLGSARRTWTSCWQGLGLDFCQFHWSDESQTVESFRWLPRELGLDKLVIVGEIPYEYHWPTGVRTPTLEGVNPVDWARMVRGNTNHLNELAYSWERFRPDPETERLVTQHILETCDVRMKRRDHEHISHVTTNYDLSVYDWSERHEKAVPGICESDHSCPN